PDRWVGLLETDPDVRIKEVLAKAADAAGAWADDAAAMSALRQMKSEASLLIAIADIGRVWDVPQVTHALTQLADTAVGAAVRYLLRKAKKGKAAKQPDI